MQIHNGIFGKQHAGELCDRLTHSVLPEFRIAWTELPFPQETSLADLMKSTALPKKSKHLIYLAANAKRWCPRRPAELCSSRLMTSLSCWCYGQADGCLAQVGMQVLRLNKVMSKLEPGWCRSGEKKDFYLETERIYSRRIETLHLKNTFPMLISGCI